MNPERFRLLEALYDEVAGLDPVARLRFIDERCAGDEEMRRELLAAFHDGSSGLTAVVERAASTISDDAWVGRRCGAYRIVRPLGRGGMGTVFLAVRDDDQFHKEVAIKTLKFDLEGRNAIVRFRHERQILANLEHPNIARVLDGGTTEQGTPYIVMEYIAGIPITEWCEQQQLSIADRLRLFRHVCGAVQYVHQHLIVHRDIKPGNILVTPDGIPRLLDFGIAKLLESGTTASDAPDTITGALLMTPDYASPEQVRGDAVSTVTDVYSLGGVLYEILTGQRPHVIGSFDPLEMARAICETPIRPPSATGNKRLRGDLDTIVLRAMQKEPSRRYPSAAELSEDVRRHLDGLPIAARQDSAAYRALKFVRRNRIGVAASTAVVAALTVGVIVSLHEARVAQRRFAQVRELANTFLFQFYDQVTPLAGSTAVRASIVETARKYLDGLSSEAGGDKDLTLELAQAYQRLGDVQGMSSSNLGQLDDSRQSFRHALALYASLPVTAGSMPDLRRRVAETWLALGTLEFDANRETAAEPNILRALEITADADTDPAIRMARSAAKAGLGEVRLRLGQNAEAVSLMESANRALLELQSSGYSDRDLSARIAGTSERLARAKVFSGDLDGALNLFLELIQKNPPCNEDGPPATGCRWLQGRLQRAADVYAAVDRPNLQEPAKAAPLYERSLHIQERVAALDANDRRAQFALAAQSGKLGDAVWQADPKRALVLYDRALATAKTLASKEQLEILRGSYLVAISRPLIRLGRTAEARTALTEALESAKTDANAAYPDRVGEIGVRIIWPALLIAEHNPVAARHPLNELIHDIDSLRASHPQDLTPIYYLSSAERLLASISSGEERREALMHSAAAWHSWPATSFTRREEQKDLEAARR